jgi:hypothetical protein
MNRRPRATSKLSPSTHKRLNSYALAASTASVGMLALALPAEATIIYTPTHQVIKNRVSYNLDLNRDGTTDFALQVKRVSGTTTFSTHLSAKPAAGNGVRGFESQFGAWASALKPGAAIGPNQYFPGQAMAEVVHTAGGNTDFLGSWLNVKNRYLGLQFKIAGKMHYGWARLSVQVTQSSTIATLTGYAYETIAGKPIDAGQTKSADDRGIELQNPTSHDIPASQPATLGLLAMGSRGLSIWRRKDTIDVAN